MRKVVKPVVSTTFILFLVSVAVGSLPQKEKPPAQFKPRDFKAALIGHAHIDLAWLWRWEETIHDIATHTFRGTLEQMDKFPGLTFAQSQAAVYEAVEKDYPELFARIKDKVRAGTWIPVGGMWAEPDLNMPDGEAFARQLLYGKRYFLEKFGVDVTVGWNPDGFGHNFQLPQILSKAGIRYYVFERCAPDKTPVFWWEGLDGSRLLAYVPPGWYLVNLKDGVRDLLEEASKNTALKDFMLLYGEGDHGGGPRETDLAAIRKFEKDKNHPRLGFVTPEEYFQAIQSAGVEFPVLKQELNFTFPACYTTQAETKKFNRELESLLLAAEKFSAVAVSQGARSYYPERDIDEAWKIVLRNQFHDILDGSSIGPVYDESRRGYEAARGRAERALYFSLEAIANQVDTQGEGTPLLVFNPLGWERTEPVEATATFQHPVAAMKVIDGNGTEVPYQVLCGKEDPGRKEIRFLFVAEKVPAFGYTTYRILEADAAQEFESSLMVNDLTAENEFFKLTLDPQTGWMSRFYDKKGGREVLDGEGNVLQAIVDEPPNMSAWELGLKETLANIGQDGATIEVLEKGPIRVVLRVTNVFRNSLFIQDIMLYHKVPRVDCRVRLNWQERNLMIKAAFPVAAKNSRAHFEIPYGAISRPVDGTEVPALRWIDITDEAGTHGLSLLNDCKYGFDVKDNIMRISLVHGATDPDPEADRGEQELVYSLYPHAGDWKEAKAFRRGYELNNRLLARTAMVHPGKWPSARSFYEVEPENIIMSAFKKESGYFSRATILRLYEVYGRETEVRISLPSDLAVMETDLIERPLAKIETDGRILRLKMKPFEIKTIRLVPTLRRSE
ncbi:MAG: glycosyl hydrolase-related protein [Candidatus Aminicenantes bacterium]|nr:glycosyl hydrolase-related protein [Candidatus Aminicenantes bacterium]